MWLFNSISKGIMSNGPARALNIDTSLQEIGHSISDPYEISTIRREDYDTHKSKSEYEDLLQANSKPSADSSRGHQGPAAFLIMGSGLEKVRDNTQIFCQSIFDYLSTRLNNSLF